MFMQIDAELIGISHHIQNSNKVKNLVLDKLLADNVITQEQFKEYQVDYQIIVIKKSWYYTWWKKVFGNDDTDAYIFKYVKFT